MRLCLSKNKMTLSIQSIKVATGFSESTINSIVASIVSTIAAQIRGGEEVTVKGLGVFKFVDKPQTEGLHPKTKKPTVFKATRKVKFTISGNFQALAQPDPALFVIDEESDEETLVEPLSATEVPPPIPAELIAEAEKLLNPPPESKWKIKAPDSSFVEVGTDELIGWGVNQATPVYSDKTGWKLAGKIPELSGLFC